MVPPEVKGLAEICHTHLVEGTLTRDLAVSCLQDAVRSNQSDSRIGEFAIKWLWNRDDSIRYPDDVDLTNSLAILLVREGKEDMMWEWIAQESQSHNVPTRNGRIVRERCDWRQAAFRGLVEAKAHLATDKSLDAALETYFRGTRVPYRLPAVSANNFCHQMLCRPTSQHPQRTYGELRSSLRFPNTSLTLWNAFYVWQSELASGSYTVLLQASLKLHHPQQPDPRPLYKWWKDSKHDRNHPVYQVKSKTAMISLVHAGAVQSWEVD